MSLCFGLISINDQSNIFLCSLFLAYSIMCWEIKGRSIMNNYHFYNIFKISYYKFWRSLASRVYSKLELLQFLEWLKNFWCWKFWIKPIFHQANLFARREAKTRIQQRDWLAKKFAASSTNHVSEFLFSLRVARTNLPSGKRALAVLSWIYMSEGMWQ